MFLTNPLMSHWLSAANATAGAMRGYWMGEMQRQQTAVAAAMGKQAMRFWSGAWMAQMASHAAPAAIDAVEQGVEHLRAVPAPGPAPRPEASAPVAAPAPTPPKLVAPPVAQLRSTVARRSTAPKRKAQATAAAARTAGKARTKARKAR
ncbi:hypothetical protein [Neoroseomonas rubea]|uniref:hypothetical protein n=1 Tax=Neoroseomonas rubea TaxID=2748666 RepID=UPI0018DF8BF7|nr:hypothetical protein [Roseomonas rubea]